MKAGSRGSVLILAMWSLFFLAALAIAIGSYVSAGLMLASHIQGRVRIEAVARAGVDRAIMEIMCRATNGWDGMQADAWNRRADAFSGVLPGGSFEVVWTAIAADGKPVSSGGVIGEERNININMASEKVLAALFVRARIEGDVETLAKAVVSRRDMAGAPLTDETETDYDARRAKPYGAVAELLMVPGMSAEALGRLQPLLTAYGSGKINVNAADTVVLASLADGTGAGTVQARDSLARKIAVFRETGRRFVEPTVNALVGELSDFSVLTPGEVEVFTAMMPELAIGSTCFGGNAVAKHASERGEERRIEFVFDVPRRCMLAWMEY